MRVVINGTQEPRTAKSAVRATRLFWGSDREGAWHPAIRKRTTTHNGDLAPTIWSALNLIVHSICDEHWLPRLADQLILEREIQLAARGVIQIPMVRFFEALGEGRQGNAQLALDAADLFRNGRKVAILAEI